MAPFVSVIIPVYNAEKYLRECLDSVVNQTLRDIEIICVDDGSTDSSPAVLAEYAARDSRVRVLTQENAGVGPARNAGIRAARGEFVAFLDPDDLLPDASVYEALYFYAKENRVRICGGGVCSLANDGKRYFPDASWGANVDQAFPREGFMRFADWQFDYGFYRYIFERALLLDDEIFFPPYIRYQDPPFCARALEAAGTFYAIRRPSYVFRDWHTPDYTDRRRVCDQLRGIRDQLKFSRERGRAKLHWLQIHRLFEEFKPHVLALVKREKSGEHVPADQSAIALLKEIDAQADMRLARRYKPDALYYSVDAEFLHPEIKVSVIIPVYNVEKYLRECLDSVVNQTLRDIEIICINDGSPDNSLAILQEYAKRDSRFVIVDQENQGVGRSRNTGIRKARGEFVCFMDPDDWYPEPDILETLYSTAKRERVCICGGSLEEHKPDGTVVRDFNPNASNWGGKFSRDEMMRFHDYQYDWGYQRFVFSRKFLVENDIFFPPYIRFQDPPFFVKAMVLAEKFYSLRKITYAYRVAYKEPVFSNPRKLFDMFLGVEDVLLLAKSHGLEKLISRILHLRFEGWAFSRMMPTLIKNPSIAQKAKEVFILFPPEIAVEVGAEWWNFLGRTVKFPFVSVIVPVYNVEKYLRECLDSVCGQTLRNIEIICVNDGSTDDSPAILEEYASRDSRMRIISQENRGLSAARNAGLSVARGKYIYFMDSDDVSPQGALGRMFAEMETNSLDVLFFGAESFFESEELEKAYPGYKTLYKRSPFETQSGQSLVLAFKKAGCGFSPSACCYCSSRIFLNENSIRFPEGILYEDNVFFWKMILSAKRAKSISDALFRRRVRAGSIMTNKKTSFRNFEGYATVVSELEKLAGTLSGTAVPEILRNHARGTSGTLVRFYREVSPEDRARSRELLAGALKDSAWLDVVRERVAEIDAGKKEEVCVDSREAVGEASEGSGDGNASSPEGKKIYPAFWVRLGAAFILNKAARKRWRERHMDLTPKDGIDVNAHPELRRDSALKRFAVRAASLFIFSKKKRKAFRAKHLNLRPRDGVDVRALSSRELARLREAKRSRSTLWRVFDALVPATRGKIAHTERHLRRAAEEQTRILIDELRRVSDENRRAFDESRRVVDENRRALGAVRAELKTVRERAESLSRELSATREALTLKTLAAKHAALDAESNLQARLGEVLESLNAARSEFAQTAAETVRATEMRHAETSSRLARLEEQCKAVQSATAEIPGKLSALSALVPASEKRVLDAVMSRDVLYDSSYEIKTREERGLCDMVSAPDFEMRFRKLIAGLPEESVETVGVIIRRLQMIKGAKTKLDLWTPEEKEQLKRIRHFEKSILKIADDLFVWKNCFLPIKHFEASVFFYNHGISQLDSVAPIRGKDILDVGGFIGDSALMLHGLTEGKVYSFEATSENYNHMLKTIELNRLTNVVPVHAAVGESKGMIELRFQGSGSSQDPMMIKDPKYVEKCPVVAIDDFVAEHGIRVGLIKVDIEGAEQSFLRGAKKTICEQKPILLISIYHNVSDFLDIKPMIESWNLGYKFKIFKPVMGTVSSETLLICEQPNA